MHTGSFACVIFQNMIQSVEWPCKRYFGLLFTNVPLKLYKNSMQCVITFHSHKTIYHVMQFPLYSLPENDREKMIDCLLLNASSL